MYWTEDAKSVHTRAGKHLLILVLNRKTLQEAVYEIIVLFEGFLSRIFLHAAS